MSPSLAAGAGLLMLRKARVSFEARRAEQVDVQLLKINNQRAAQLGRLLSFVSGCFAP